MNKNYFAGLKVLDHTRYLLGGYCTQILADLGAEVIKIESPGVGDFCRMEEPMRNGVSHYFSALNRKKKSIAIDLKSEAGKKAYLKLVESADIVVENFRPGVMKKLGIDFDEECKVKPDIIHCGMTSFGKDDPRSLMALHDINFQALSGYLSVNHGGITPIHMVDVSTGMAAIESILAAVLQRNFTGESQYCDIKMFDSFIWWNSLIDARYDFQGSVDPDTLDFPALAYNVYETGDGGRVSIGMLEEKFWRSFLEGLGREELIPFKRCRRQEAPEAFAELEKEFKAKTTAEWREWLQGRDICAMVAYNKEEAIDYIVSSNTGLMVYKDFPIAGKTLQTRIPVSVSSLNVDLDDATECPKLGEHSVQVLKDVGYSGAEAAQMLQDKVIEVH